MPGIAGLITRMPPREAADQLGRMVRTLRHEPFYTACTWIDENAGVYVGWTAHEHSFSDGMPLRNERGDVVLVFSGEDFPEPGVAQRLREDGHDVHSTGPSYLVHLAEEEPEFPAGLNGRFHGLLADRRRGTTLLFNDRYGMHRLYYHESKEAFYFAAEAKAILAARPELRTLDPQGLGEFVACGAVLENRTLFAGIQLLPPASTWIFRCGSLEKKTCYFYPREWEEQERLDPETYYQKLRDDFARNLPRYFKGDQRIAMSLTGGLDTRIIMAWHKPEPGALPCYTFGGILRDCEDVRVARMVARACGQCHEVIPVERDFLANFSHYAERALYLTDGCVEVSRAADLYLNQRAREIGPVRMTGLYGGEILRRVRTFKPSKPLAGLFVPEIVACGRRAEETYARVVDAHPVSFAAFRQCPWHLYGSLALEQTQYSVRTPFLDNDVVHTVFRAPESALANNQASLRLIADGNPALLRIPTDRGPIVPKRGVHKTVSHALLEFLFRAEYAYDMGMPQWVARIDHRLSPLHLERLFLGQHKIFHFRTWYRDALAGYVREMLLSPRSLSRPYVEREGLEAAIRGHLCGSRNYTIEIHKALTLEILHRLFLDSGKAGESAASAGISTLLSSCSISSRVES